jgi:mediator of RNA polymerase II transcription subunit 5
MTPLYWPDSVLVLYQSYPADPGLNSYLKAAIQDGILPLPVYVSTFLDAFTVTRTQLNAEATLDFLCDLAVTMHEESGHLPLGSLVSSSEDSLHILLNVQRCLGLIDWAYSMPLTRRSQKLRQNSGKLMVHLLSCVNDMSQVTIADAWEQMNVVTSVLQKPELERGVREHLDSLSMNLAMILQDEPKAAREAQMLQSMQMAKGDVGGPNSENDVITLGLLWQYLVRPSRFEDMLRLTLFMTIVALLCVLLQVTHRAHEFGAGSTKQAVALILSHWRSSSWPPQVFYAQVFISAFTCVASNIGNPLIWKAFTVGRVSNIQAPVFQFQIY